MTLDLELIVYVAGVFWMAWWIIDDYCWDKKHSDMKRGSVTFIPPETKHISVPGSGAGTANEAQRQNEEPKS